MTSAYGEIDCLKELFEKLLIVSPSDFCSSNISICDSKNSTVLEFKITVNGTQSEAISPDRLDCLPNLNFIMFDNVILSFDFFYHPFNNNLQNVFVYNYYGTFYIDQPIVSKFGSLHITAGNYSVINPVKIFKISDIVNIEYFFLSGFYVRWEIGELEDKEIRSKTIAISALNYPNFTGLNLDVDISFSFIFNGNFDLGSIPNFATISSPSVIVQHLGIVGSIPFYYNNNNLIKSISTVGSYITPTSFISMKNTNYSKFSMIIDSLFNFNSKFPLIDISNNVELKIVGGKFQSLEQSISSLGNLESSVILQNNGMNSNLEKFTGIGYSYDLSDNKYLQGTIDSSWCNTQLNVRNNSFTGEIPSCFACYLNSKSMFDKFNYNQFTNFDINYKCITFAPRVNIADLRSNKFILSGIDIGYEVDNWLYNGTVGFSNYKINKIGKEYELTIPLDQQATQINTFESINYFSILFKLPGNKLITFPVIEKEPTPESIEIISNNQIKVTGTFFSSYFGYINQNVTLLGLDCIIEQDVSFFGFKCKLQDGAELKSDGDGRSLLKIKTGNLLNQVFIQTSNNFINNKQCKNDCKDIPNTICDLSDGQCKCHKDDNLVDCQHYITSIESSTIEGGNATFNGYFTDYHNNLSITIGGLNCFPIFLNTSNTIICKAPPGNGIKDTIIYQNLLSYTDKYEYRNLILKCPLDCSNHGICNTDTGICLCDKGYLGYDCNTREIQTSTTTPSTNTTIDNNGTTLIKNQEIEFQIYFQKLLELDFNGNIINEYQLKNNWIFNHSDSNSNNQYIFKQLIQTDKLCTITSTIHEIKTPQEFTFADTKFTLDSGSIKLSLSIENYKYSSNLNTLQLQIISSVNDGNNQDGGNNECNEKETNIELINDDDESTSFNYIKISKNNKLLSGRFINKLVSDGKPTYFTTTTIKNQDDDNNNSILISLNLPHCVDQCLIDPDWSLLVESDFQSKCKSSRPKWFLPVVVVVPVVGTAILITTIFLLYKRNTIFKVYAHKLKRLNKN